MCSQFLMLLSFKRGPTVHAHTRCIQVYDSRIMESHLNCVEKSNIPLVEKVAVIHNLTANSRSPYMIQGYGTPYYPLQTGNIILLHFTQEAETLLLHTTQKDTQTFVFLICCRRTHLQQNCLLFLQQVLCHRWIFSACPSLCWPSQHQTDYHLVPSRQYSPVGKGS